MAVKCPLNARWVIAMLEVLPEGSQGKLAVYAECPEVKEALDERRREAEAVLSE